MQKRPRPPSIQPFTFIEPRTVTAFYSGVTLNLTSSMWQLLTQIDGLTFADGMLAVPRSGVRVA